MSSQHPNFNEYYTVTKTYSADTLTSNPPLTPGTVVCVVTRSVAKPGAYVVERLSWNYSLNPIYLVDANDLILADEYDKSV